MSRHNPDYEKTLQYRLKRWIEVGTPDIEERYTTEEDFDPKKEYRQPTDWSKVFVPPAANDTTEENRVLKIYRKVNVLLSILICTTLVLVMLATVSNLPAYGTGEAEGNPRSNEVVERYIVNGVEEGGATNLVANVILDYRAFDTFGESCVLFIAGTCVFIMLRMDDKGKKQKRVQEDVQLTVEGDPILQRIVRFLLPIILIFGFYILVNGHLSPGGGFSGGAIMGASLILYLNAFGFDHIHRFFTEKIYKRVTCTALVFYCLAKSYSFFTGANHLHSIIPKGTPGNILSSGLILPLNVAVGFVVTVTMYAFYALFRRGEL